MTHICCPLHCGKTCNQILQLYDAAWMLLVNTVSAISLVICTMLALKICIPLHFFKEWAPTTASCTLVHLLNGKRFPVSLSSFDDVCNAYFYYFQSISDSR
jgi:hypothetical protein